MIEVRVSNVPMRTCSVCGKDETQVEFILSPTATECKEHRTRRPKTGRPKKLNPKGTRGFVHTFMVPSQMHEAIEKLIVDEQVSFSQITRVALSDYLIKKGLWQTQ